MSLHRWATSGDVTPIAAQRTCHQTWLKNLDVSRFGWPDVRARSLPQLVIGPLTKLQRLFHAEIDSGQPHCREDANERPGQGKIMIAREEAIEHQGDHRAKK